MTDLEEERVLGKSYQSFGNGPKVGISPYLNITVGRYNAQSEDIKLLLDYSKQKNIQLLNVATLEECGLK